MSQVQKELEKITTQLNAFPSVLKEARVEVAQKSAIATELVNTSDVMTGLNEPYYAHIKEYASQRALIYENSTSRLDFYDINGPSNWQGLSTAFTFPSTTEFIFYPFDEQGNPIAWSASYYVVESEPGVLAKPQNVGIFLQDPVNYVIPSYTVSDVTVNGVVHKKITFSSALNTEPEIGSQVALLDNATDEVIGYIEVGIEGLSLNDTWDAFEPVNLDDESATDAWFGDMLDLSNTQYGSLAGDFIDGSVPEDDVITSADGSVVSSSSQPYTQAKLERSPFYPALTADEDDYPPDFDAPDTVNRKFVQDGTPQWAVYPKFRWEGKLIPTSLSSGVYDEELPSPPRAVSDINAFTGITVNQTDFPVNDGVNDIYYYWDQATDKIFESDETDPLNPVVSEYPCTYNSMTDKIAEYEANFKPLFDSLKARVSSFTNTLEPSQATNDTSFQNGLQAIEDDYNAFLAHHNSWFSAGDDQDTSVFQSSIGTYDQSFYTTLETTLGSGSLFTDRITEIETLIGDAQDKTGYVGEVLKAVNLIVNRNFGVTSQLLRKFNQLPDLKTALVKLRKKYDAYS